MLKLNTIFFIPLHARHSPLDLWVVHIDATGVRVLLQVGAPEVKLAERRRSVKAPVVEREKPVVLVLELLVVVRLRSRSRRGSRSRSRNRCELVFHVSHTNTVLRVDIQKTVRVKTASTLIAAGVRLALNSLFVRIMDRILVILSEQRRVARRFSTVTVLPREYVFAEGRLSKRILVGEEVAPRQPARSACRIVLDRRELHTRRILPPVHPVFIRIHAEEPAVGVLLSHAFFVRAQSQ